MIGLAVFAAILGLVVGSFLNVVVIRVPSGQSIVKPSSRCPACRSAIASWDNIPVISWLVLRGRCRSCHTTISLRYPAIELLTAALFAGAAIHFGFDWSLPAVLVLFAGLIALACIDLEHYLLPLRIVYPVLGLLCGLLLLAAAVTGDWGHLLSAVVCAVVWFGVFFGIHALNPRLLGFGDVRLVLVIGFGLGWLGVRFVLVGLIASSFLGALAGLTMIAIKRGDRNTPIPYGVFLALGTILSVFVTPLVPGRF